MSSVNHPVAELRNVCVDISGTRILSDINLSIAAGTTVAVIGTSGSGKSTLLRLFNGLQPATQGTVLRNATPIDQQNLRALRMTTGYALQEIGLFPHLSVYDNISLPMTLAGHDKAHIKARIDTLVALMQLTDVSLDRYPATLSGGQQQRAGLCRAMALAPTLLLLDEAFSGLDAITRVETHRRFLALQSQSPTTCLLVTHDLSEARRIADYLVILHQGQIVRQGKCDTVLNDPQHPYARALVEMFSE